MYVGGSCCGHGVGRAALDIRSTRLGVRVCLCVTQGPDTPASTVLPWASGYDDAYYGGAAGASDECILHYVRTSGTNNRAVCLDKFNNGVCLVGGGVKLGSASSCVQHRISFSCVCVTQCVVAHVVSWCSYCAVWVGGWSAKNHDHINSTTGNVFGTVIPSGAGGYGCLVDGADTLWMSGGYGTYTLFHMKSGGTTSDIQAVGIPTYVYGLTIDKST